MRGRGRGAMLLNRAEVIYHIIKGRVLSNNVRAGTCLRSRRIDSDLAYCRIPISRR